MSSSYTASFWEKDTFLKPQDLIVVGAGIVGLSAALFYRRSHPGARVTVLERGFIPKGASTRNAGFACVGSITEHLADLEKDSGEELKKRIRWRYEGLGLLKETLGEEEIGYDPCGGYELFTSTRAYDEAVARIPMFNEWMEELTGERQVYAPKNMNGYRLIHNRLEGALHPGKMMGRLIERAASEGVQIKWNTPVAEAPESGEVVLGQGLRLKAEKVLIAVNGFARELLPELAVRPARGLVFVTGELRYPQWKGTFHHDRGYIYFRNVGNRLLLGGARNVASSEEETSRFGTNEQIKKHLVDFADGVLKLEKGWQIDHEWSGIMGFTDSKTPVLKRLDRHRTVAAGLSGMGIAIGMAVGKEAAGMISEG